MYNVLLEEFCETYQLKEVVDSFLIPQGITNRTYFVRTIEGKYVIKALNPNNVNTENKIKKIEISEYIAEIAHQAGISSIYANRINGRIINEFHGQYYIVFDFFNGEKIKGKYMSYRRCLKLGHLLAELHCVNFENILSNFDYKVIKYDYGKKLKSIVNWNYYLEKISKKKQTPKWFVYLEERIGDLYYMFEGSFSVFNNFKPQDKLISHGDIFSQNILWCENIPYIIDWETSGVIDATYDCLHTAIRIATESTEDFEKIINMAKVYAFLKGYSAVRKIEVKRLEIALYMIWYKRLDLLRSALKRYIKPKDKLDKKRASRQVKYSLTIVKSYKEFQYCLEDIKDYIIKQQPVHHLMRYKLINFFLITNNEKKKDRML